jgi:putative transposase
VNVDARTTTIRAEPSNKLSEAELAVCNRVEHAHLSPSQIVPRLADEGVYLASESTFYRLLRANNQGQRRGRAQAPRPRQAPTSYCATAANQVCSWDITYLPTPVRRQYDYLYLVEDIYSRKGVGWEVHEQESGGIAAELRQRAVMAERCWSGALVLHSDKGAPIKSATLLAKLYDLGVTPFTWASPGQQRQPLFRVPASDLELLPAVVRSGFTNLDEARAWVCDFMTWYNHEHCHSRISFVTPAQRHRGVDYKILAKRHAVYQAARAMHPERLSGETRDWSPIGAVMLNSDRTEVVLQRVA